MPVLEARVVHQQVTHLLILKSDFNTDLYSTPKGNNPDFNLGTETERDDQKPDNTDIEASTYPQRTEEK